MFVCKTKKAFVLIKNNIFTLHANLNGQWPRHKGVDDRMGKSALKNRMLSNLLHFAKFKNQY